jgi:hypothetical protein
MTPLGGLLGDVCAATASHPRNAHSVTDAAAKVIARPAGGYLAVHTGWVCHLVAFTDLIV